MMQIDTDCVPAPCWTLPVRFGTLPGALLRTLVAQLASAFTDQEAAISFTALPSPDDPGQRLRSGLSISVDHAAGSGIVVALHGEADLSTRRALSDVLCQVIARRSGAVVIDLGEATFIDTATTRVLATAHQLLACQDRALSFRSPSRLAAEMLGRFDLTDLVEDDTGGQNPGAALPMVSR